MKSALIVAMTTLALGSAFADAAELGTIRQGLGEQCAIVATVENNTNSGGGCGGGSTSKYVDVTYTISAQAGKQYILQTSYVDSYDNQYALSPTGDSVTYDNGTAYLYSSYDRNVTLNAEYVADQGQYQIKLSLINASTGAEVCSTSTMISVN